MKDGLQKGISYFELMVVAAILSVVLFIFLDRARGVQDMASEVSTEHVRSAINTSLQVRAARLLGAGKDADLVKLVDVNPVSLLLKAPAGYIGERSTPPPTENHWRWYYDLNDKCLVFMLNNRKNVATEGQKVLKYKVKLQYSPLLPGNREAAITGVALVQVQ